jgi:glycosyltransferase involved in cell wall biosynthesis
MTNVHLLGLPNAPTTADYPLCGFTQATRRFARILDALGAHVTLYASDENDAPCAELVPVITREEQTTLLDDTPYQYATMADKIGLWQLTNPRIAKAIGERKQPRDLICLIGGLSQQAVAAAHPDLMTVEYSIGYIGSFAPYRVYESQIWRHCTHGFQDQIDGRFFDAVIPLFFDPAEFPYQAIKEPFALYVGRLVPKKGVAVACEAAAIAGVPLKVIGHGDPALVTHGAEYLGVLPTVERNQWLARASCLICPTLYLEPFGAMAVEAQLCGTPVLSTNFGGFVETVRHGETGYRGDTLGDFVDALHHLDRLWDAGRIRDRAVQLYSLTTATAAYRRYFDRLALLWDQGWAILPAPSRAGESVYV